MSALNRKPPIELVDLEDPTAVDVGYSLLECIRCAAESVAVMTPRLAAVLESLPALAAQLPREELHGLAHALAISAGSAIPAIEVVERFAGSRPESLAARVARARLELLALCVGARAAAAADTDDRLALLALVTKVEIDDTGSTPSLLCWAPALRPDVALALLRAVHECLDAMGSAGLQVRVMGVPPAYGELPIGGTQ